MSDDLVTWLRAQLDEDERAVLALFFPDLPPDLALDELRSMPPIGRLGPARVLREVEAKRRVISEHQMIGPWPHGGINASTIPATFPDVPVCCGTCCWAQDGSTGVSYGDWPCVTLAALASVYSDRPGWREEWRP